MDEPPSTGGVTVHVTDQQDLSVDIEALKWLAALTAERAGCPSGTEIGLSLVGDSTMARLNRDSLGKSGPTDVLSFPIVALSPGEPPPGHPDGPPVLLGDVAIAPAFVRARSEAAGDDFGAEMALMVVHGVLHLLGYDHQDDAEAEHMEERERVLLAEIGVVRK